MNFSALRKGPAQGSEGRSPGNQQPVDRSAVTPPATGGSGSTRSSPPPQPKRKEPTRAPPAKRAREGERGGPSKTSRPRLSESSDLREVAPATAARLATQEIQETLRQSCSWLQESFRAPESRPEHEVLARDIICASPPLANLPLGDRRWARYYGGAVLHRAMDFSLNSKLEEAPISPLNAFGQIGAGLSQVVF